MDTELGVPLKKLIAKEELAAPRELQLSQAQQPLPSRGSRAAQAVIVGDYWVIGKVTHLFGKRADGQEEGG